MREITYEFLMDTLDQSSDVQKEMLVAYFNQGLDGWAGIHLGNMMIKYAKKIEGDEESDRKFEADLDNPSIDAIHSDRLKGY